MLVNLLASLPFFSAFFWALVLLIDDKTNNSKIFLTGFFFLTTINYFTHWLFFTKEYDWYIVFDHIWVFTSLSAFPLIYYYLRLLAKDSKFSIKWFWLIVIPLLVMIFSILVYWTASPAEKHAFIYSIMYHEEPMPDVSTLHIKLFLFRNALLKVIFIIQLLLTWYYSSKILKKYDKEINLFYSNVKEKDLKYAEKMLNLFIFAVVVSAISSIIGKDYLVEKPVLFFMVATTHTVFVFALGYLGYRQEFTIEDFQKDMSLESDFSTLQLDHPSVSERGMHQMKVELIKLVEEDEVFMNPDLKITDISKMLNTNRTYISHIINEELKMSFSEFINGYRVAYAKKILKDKDASNLTLSQIAEMSGFSNDSTFYRVFKSIEKTSPGVYREG